MVKQKLVKEFKSTYLNVHGVKCKDLELSKWTVEQLNRGITALNVIAGSK